MREVVPGIAVVAVIFADGSPLPLAEIRSPLFPRDALLSRFIQSLLFCYIDNVCDTHRCSLRFDHIEDGYSV